MMRDYNTANSAPEDAIYKDVVVVGNGPSGIMLSHLFAGNWPYFAGGTHPDELLNARLQGLAPGRSLVQQDLRFLSEGLEGRTNNAVSLLMDTLHHPCADLGLDLPSMLVWRRNPERVVDHVVLGKGPPGGAWQAMDGNVLTISLGSWMEMPDSDYRVWESTESRVPVSPRDSRASSASIARYYADYVKTKRLGRYFRQNCVVTSVRPLGGTPNSERCESIDPETGIPCGDEPRWITEGYDSATDTPFCYVSRKVVLATGSCDLPNRLRVPGELNNPSWVMHDLRQLEVALDKLAETTNEDGTDCDPVLIVGAGLSAADAVISARFRGLPIVHVFRKRVTGLEKQLPESMYPEYHKVHQMMGDGGANYPHYTALPEHKILELGADRKVRLLCPDGTVIAQRVSLAAILIGSRPDLGFLSPVLKLGRSPEEPVDCRSNPVAVEPMSYEATNAPPGLHALGPLAGDNFVRFIQGGAIAITSHVHKQIKLRTF